MAKTVKATVRGKYIVLTDPRTFEEVCWKKKETWLVLREIHRAVETDPRENQDGL